MKKKQDTIFDIDITGKRLLSKPKHMIISKLDKINIDLPFKISRYKFKELWEYISTKHFDIELITSHDYKK